MYSELAAFYDAYTGDMDREKLADFLCVIFKEHGPEGLAQAAGYFLENGRRARRKASSDGSDVKKSTLVIDVGCGTGELTFEMAARGFDMTGLDISPEMLGIAASKRRGRKGPDILWLCQDMCEMDTYGSYAAMYCLEDGVNHITREGGLGMFLERAYNFIDPEGLLVFDFLTDRYFREVAAEGFFFEDGENGTCLWTADYEDRLMRYDIVCYSAGKNGLYSRTDDTVEERAYTTAEVRNTLKKCGFSVIGIIPAEETGTGGTNGRFFAVARRNSGKTPEKRRKNTGKAGK